MVSWASPATLLRIHQETNVGQYWHQQTFIFPFWSDFLFSFLLWFLSFAVSQEHLGKSQIPQVPAQPCCKVFKTRMSGALATAAAACEPQFTNPTIIYHINSANLNTWATNQDLIVPWTKTPLCQVLCSLSTEGCSPLQQAYWVENLMLLSQMSTV